jgi:N-acetylmuramoyl-L-alanine amidase
VLKEWTIGGMWVGWDTRARSAPWPAFVLAVVAAGVLLLALAGIASAAELPSASAARVVGDGKKTRFVADISEALSFSVYVVPDPYRVIIDMPEVSFDLAEGSGRKVRGLVREYRYGVLERGRARIVLDTDGPVLIDKSFVVKPEDGQPARIVVDLVKTSREAFLRTYRSEIRLADTGLPPLAEGGSTEETASIPDEIAPGDGEPTGLASLLEGDQPAPLPRLKPGTEGEAQKPKAKKGARPVIVIDPGHGGIDSGATSKLKTKEKDVVLAFGLELRDQLLARGGFSVIMTRDGDRFISLRDRVRAARSHQADLFIAIHADTVRGPSAHGATLYTVSERASDAEAEALAKKENAADIIAGVELGAEAQEIADILIDLAQRETKNHSTGFAKITVAELKPVTRLTGVPLRSAGFVVLKAPDVPSVLMELGYLSSKADEQRLISPEWRKKVAAAVVRSIAKHFAR